MLAKSIWAFFKFEPTLSAHALSKPPPPPPPSFWKHFPPSLWLMLYLIYLILPPLVYLLRKVILLFCLDPPKPRSPIGTVGKPSRSRVQ
jgi:hypothetical protein